jgi:Tfp pilus assembly protein PilO
MGKLHKQIQSLITKWQEGLDKKKIASILVFAALIITLDFMFVIKLQLNAVKTTQTKITKLKKDLSILNKDLYRLQASKAGAAGLGQKQGLPRVKKIIAEKEIASVLEEVSDLANRNDIRILDIKPAKAKDEKISKDIPNLGSVIIAMNLFGDYHRLGRFINELENGALLLSVESLRITPNPRDNLMQDAVISVKVYVKR